MNLKSVITSKWTLLGILVGVIVFNTYLHCQKDKPLPEAQVNNPLLLQKVDSFRDANGKLYAQLEERIYTQAQVNHLLDSMAKVLGIKVKNIKGVERIVYQTDTIYKNLPSRPIFIVSNHDTAYQVERHDGWNDIVATAGPDSGSIVFRSRDTLTRLEISKSPLIGPTKNYIYLTNTNPSNQIREGASFIIKEKQSWLSIGPYIGYDPFSNRLSIGIGAQFPIINL